MFYGIDLDFFDIGDIVIDIGRLTGRGAGTDLKSVCSLNVSGGRDLSLPPILEG